jgi:GMP synthase (glutamine-hydrolysing)
VAAFRVGAGIRAVQFHPEFDAEVMRGYLLARGDAVRSEGGDPDVLLAGVRRTVARRILVNFARFVSR